MARSTVDPDRAQTQANAQELSLAIPDMHCASCVQRVETALAQVPGVEAVAVHLATRSAKVRLSGPVPPEQLLEAVRSAGYTARILDADVRGAARRELERSRRRWAVRALAGAACLVTVLALWLAYRQLGDASLLGAAILATAAQLGIGASFYRGALRRLRYFGANMDTLVALGTTAAYGVGMADLVAALGAAQGASMGFRHVSEQILLLTVISFGRMLEAGASLRTGDAVERLLQLSPKTARRRLPDGSVQEVAASDLGPGDVVVVRPGEQIPVDGEIIEGESAIQEAALTGEPLPRDVGPGDRVFAGTTNVTGMILVVSRQVGASTVLAQIAATVDEALTRKSRLERLADRIAGVFVPVVLVLAVLTFLVHAWGLGRGVHAGVLAAAAVVLVACPCALGLATPVAVQVAAGRAAELGFLIRNAAVLEKRPRAVMLDKTGTLTLGRPRVVGFHVIGRWEERELLHLAGALAATSNHPASQAVHAFAVERASMEGEAKNVLSFAGKGVSGRVGPHMVKLGSAQFLRVSDDVLEQVSPDEPGTVVWMAVDGQVAGAFMLADELRPEAKEAIEEFRKQGLEVYIASGDRFSAVRALADDLGIAPERVRGELTPDGKAAWVEELQGSGLTVAFIGDGINDAPPLAQADVGIAVGEASDIAREAGDIVLLKRGLSPAVTALLLVMRARRIIVQNLFWAFAYNVLLIPGAAAGYVPPALAGTAMAFSSVTVVGNALRIRRQRPWGTSRPARVAGAMDGESIREVSGTPSDGRSGPAPAQVRS